MNFNTILETAIGVAVGMVVYLFASKALKL
jgi:hypothetical protein